MNIRVFLCDVAGSSEKDIEEIERYLLGKQPFGLACSRSIIIFMPDKEKAYWLWSDHSPGPVFQSTGWSEFCNMVKMQYLSHKKVLSPDDILAVTSILDYERKQKQLAALRSSALPKPADKAGQMETGADRIIACRTNERSALPQSACRPADAVLLPEPIRNAEDIPGDEGENAAGA